MVNYGSTFENDSREMKLNGRTTLNDSDYIDINLKKQKNDFILKKKITQRPGKAKNFI